MYNFWFSFAPLTGPLMRGHSIICNATESDGVNPRAHALTKPRQLSVYVCVRAPARTYIWIANYNAAYMLIRHSPVVRITRTAELVLERARNNNSSGRAGAVRVRVSGNRWA